MIASKNNSAWVAAVVLIAGFTSSCGGGSSSQNSSGSLSGNWQMLLTRTVPTAPFSRTQSGFLMQTGNSVSGGLTLSENAVGNCASTGAVQGSVNGTNVSITVDENGQTVNLDGTSSANGSTVSGTYSIFANGCGLSETGTWSGTRVNSLNGNVQATFTSNNASLVPYVYSGMVSQGPNLASSNATLSGSMTATNAPCANNLTVSGTVSGTTVVFNLISINGVSIGDIQGTASTDGSTITGNYSFSNASTNVLAHCGGGDSGTISMTVQ